MSEIPDRLYYRIGEVAEIAGVKPYVLRYWESEFSAISPQKSSSGQRVYRKGDLEAVLTIKQLLYVERYSVEGARKRLQELKKDKAKREILAATPPPSSEARRKIRGAVVELQAAIARPITELFPTRS